MQYLVEWTIATKKAASSYTSSVCFFSWQKPTPNFYKLNVDGTRSWTGMIGAGGRCYPETAIATGMLVL